MPDVHRVDRRGEEVARAILLEQPVLGASRREAGIADDREREMAPERAKRLPGTAQHRGRKNEQRVVHCFGGRGDVLTRIARRDVGALENPVQPVVGRIAALLLAPPPLRLTPGLLVQCAQLLLGERAAIRAEQRADGGTTKGDALGERTALVQRIPVIEGQSAKHRARLPAVVTASADPAGCRS